jgi:uncharacterized membrane protein YfcA
MSPPIAAPAADGPPSPPRTPDEAPASTPDTIVATAEADPGNRLLDPASTGAFVASLSGPDYRVHRFGWGIVGSLGAGLASALLGIGGGLIKVPTMHVIMGVPLRVATATSNLMIGITASASAIIYLIRGGIDPYAAAPTAIGVFIGASIGSRIAHRIDLRILRGLFVVILLYTAWQMLQRAFG